MNDDMILFAVLGVVACVFIAGFSLFHIYKGTYASLASARVGDVYNFRYVQPMKGTYERYLAKVIDVTKLDEYWIKRLDRISNYRKHDEMFERSKTLVTCLMKDGTFRQFYGERCDMVRRPLLGGLLFKAGIVHLF